MVAMGILVVALAAATPAATPAASPSPADDVAAISNTACLRRATGEIAFPHPAQPEFDVAIAALGLKPGIDRAALDMLGPATHLILRAAMAHRVNGASYIVMASDGALPGCRTILLGDAPSGAAEAVAAALTRPGTGGWTAFPDMTASQGPVTKRVFLRREKGKPYLLNLIELIQPVGKIRLYTTVIAVPPEVTLPRGF
jgi:hypothetical protein